MTRNDVILAMITAGLFRGAWTLGDDVYDGLSTQFVQQAFEDWVASLPAILTTPFQIGGGKTRLVPRYIPEVYDCENHSHSFANFIDEACALDAATKSITRGNPAFGFFDFTRADGVRHSRNWMIDRSGVVLTFDAGLGDFTTQDAAELASITQGTV